MTKGLFSKVLVASAVLVSGLTVDAYAANPNGGVGVTKVWVCHATGSASNPYREIVVDDNGSSGNINWKGHNVAHHTRDLYFNEPGKCPKAVAATPTPTATPTTDPSVSPSPTEPPVEGIAGFGVEVESWQEVPVAG